jgi:hypothetical protein
MVVSSWPVLYAAEADRIPIPTGLGKRTRRIRGVGFPGLPRRARVTASVATDMPSRGSSTVRRRRSARPQVRNRQPTGWPTSPTWRGVCFGIRATDSPRARAPPRSEAGRHRCSQSGRRAGLSDDWIARQVNGCRWQRERLTTPARLREHLAVLPHNMRHRRVIEEVLDDVGSGAYSFIKVHYLRAVERPHGLPSGSRQRRVSAGRRIWFRDVEYLGLCLVVEPDGRLGHETFDERSRDMTRDNHAAADRRRTLRAGYRHAMSEACETALLVSQILRQQGWRGVDVARVSGGQLGGVRRLRRTGVQEEILERLSGMRRHHRPLRVAARSGESGSRNSASSFPKIRSRSPTPTAARRRWRGRRDRRRPFRGRSCRVRRCAPAAACRRHHPPPPRRCGAVSR